LNITGEEIFENQGTPTLPDLPEFLDDLRNVSDDELAGRFAIEITPTNTINREAYKGPLYYRYKAEVGTIQEMILTNSEPLFAHPVHMHINHMQVMSYNEYTGPVGITIWDYWPFTTYRMFDQSGQVCKYQHESYNESISIAYDSSSALEYLGHAERFQGNSTLGYVQLGEWRDVILLPPLSNITVRFRTDHYKGPVLIHCHMTADSDMGMMTAIGIVEKGSDLSYNATSNGIYPWACQENNPVGIPFERTTNESSFYDETTQAYDATIETTTSHATSLRVNRFSTAYVAVSVGAYICGVIWSLWAP